MTRQFLLTATRESTRFQMAGLCRPPVWLAILTAGVRVVLRFRGVDAVYENRRQVMEISPAQRIKCTAVVAQHALLFFDVQLCCPYSRISPTQQCKESIHTKFWSTLSY
jgi:hypothetical protein